MNHATPPPEPTIEETADTEPEDEDTEPEDDIDGEATMTHLELQSFDPDDSAEITREDFREASRLVSQAAKRNLKKTRQAFKACEGSRLTIRLPKRNLDE